METCETAPSTKGDMVYLAVEKVSFQFKFFVFTDNFDNASLSPSGSKTLPRLRNKDQKWRKKYSPKFLRKLHHSVSDYDVMLDGSFDESIDEEEKLDSKDNVTNNKTMFHNSNWSSDPCLLEPNDSLNENAKIPAIVIQRTSIRKKSSKSEIDGLKNKRHSNIETGF